MVDVIACFLTCGYTEAGAMQFFLKKINDRYEYRQCLPNKTIKKKGMPKKIDDKMSGRTGEALLEKVYELIEKHRDEYSQCRAILVEDDLDGRFAGAGNPSGIYPEGSRLPERPCRQKAPGNGGTYPGGHRSGPLSHQPFIRKDGIRHCKNGHAQRSGGYAGKRTYCH